MNEEEKKAIKKINKITEECEQICIERNEDTEIYTDEPVPYIEYRTILNLLETQSKQIDLMAKEMYLELPAEFYKERIRERTGKIIYEIRKWKKQIQNKV